MKKGLKFALVVVFGLFFRPATAQINYTVKGIVQDTAGNSLPGAIVRVVSGKDSVSASTGIDGSFVLNNVKFQQFTLKAAYIGFKTHLKAYQNTQNKKLMHIPVIRLKENSNTLQEVVIKSEPPVKVKEDTVQFDAKAYKVREGDAVEEVIKKLPGLTVDKDGKVTSQGKPITKIRVNGKDFFGTDVATAIQNLPADIVQNIQVVDDYGDQAKITGIKADEPEKILNINIQPDKKKGYYIAGTGGMGSSERYIANVRGNTFKGERQISFDASLNNTSLRGGGGNGITNNRTFATSYKNEWNKKINADWSYRINDNDNTTESSTFQQTFYEDFTRTANSNSTNKTFHTGHSFSGNFELNIDTMNYLKVSPFLNVNDNESRSYGGNNTVAQRASLERAFNNESGSGSFNYGTNLFFNHKFLRKGRNISLWSTVNFTDGDSDRSTRNNDLETDSAGTETPVFQYLYVNSFNDNFRAVANLTYTEPLSTSSFLDFRYNYSYSNTRNGRDLNNVDPVSEERTYDPLQSNNYNYQFITNRIGVSFRKVHQKYNFSAGVNAQPVVLKGNDLSRNINTRKETFNFIPSARFVYRFSKQKSLTANYFARSSQPSFNQLQPITDSTNRNNIVVGNQNLNPEFVQTLAVDYNQSDWKKGNMFFANFNLSQTGDKIVTTRTQIPGTVIQRTTYINTDGFYSMRGNYSYAIPFAERRYTLTLYGGGNFSNNVGFNNGAKNIAKNYVADQGVKFRLDIKDVIDTEFNTNYSFNTTNYSLASSTDRKTNRYNFSLEGRNYLFKDLTIGYRLNKTINQGYSSGNPNPTIINVFAEYRFLKGNRGAFRLHAFDLLDENTGITRDVFDSEIIDSRTNRLGRYFLLSFNLRMRKFG